MVLGTPYPSSIFPKAPVRAADLTFLIEQLTYGHHCALLGASNMGKSALLNSLATPTARHLLGPKPTKDKIPYDSNSQITLDGGFPNADDWNSLPSIIVFVDCLEAGDSEHAFYEVIMRRITEEFALWIGKESDSDLTPRQSLSTPERSSPALSEDELKQIHQAVLQSPTEVAFRSAFASGLRKLLSRTACRLVLILDEFDDSFRSLPPWPFRQLRATANLHNGANQHARIQYVLATTHQLSYLRTDNETYEFRELFQMTTHPLMPLDEDDALRLMSYLDTQEPESSAPQLVHKIVAAAGGHPGLLERIHALISRQAIDITSDMSVEALVQVLLKARPIQTECERLWRELEEAEQAAVLSLLDTPSRPANVAVTRLKGLSRINHESTLFSPLWAATLRQQMTKLVNANSFANNLERGHGGSLSTLPGITVEPQTGQIWADGEEITWTLASEHQRSLVRLLVKRSGAVCSYNEIADHVYGVGDGVTPGAIRELVNRTRKKLPDSGYIINVPGEGYRLKVSD